MGFYQISLSLKSCHNHFLIKSIPCGNTNKKRKKAGFSRKTRHNITRSTFVKEHTIKLLLGSVEPLGEHLVLEEQHGPGLHVGAELLVLRLGEVLPEHGGHHRPSLLDAGHQGLGLAQLIQQLLTFVLQHPLQIQVYTLNRVLTLAKK